MSMAVGELLVRLAQGPRDHEAAFTIRWLVFVAEQGVPLADEFDGLDAAATHLLAHLAARPVGTLRWRRIAPDTAKIERVAVLRECRRHGVGQALIAACLVQLQEARIATAVLHAQAHAQAFYGRFGFHPEGGPFIEDGIEHVRMRLRLQTATAGQPQHRCHAVPPDID
jgi:predicted GNAT family N-acyltransferase